MLPTEQSEEAEESKHLCCVLCTIMREGAEWVPLMSIERVFFKNWAQAGNVKRAPNTVIKRAI